MTVSTADAAGASEFMNAQQDAPDLIYRSICLDATVAFELHGQCLHSPNFIRLGLTGGKLSATSS